MASRKDVEAGRAYVTLMLKNQVERGLRRAQAQLMAFGKAVKAVGADLQNIGKQMTAFGTAIAIPLGLAVKRFADFDDAMRAVQAVSQSTDAQLASLTATAKNLGATTSFTAVQVANLMTELGRAGFTAEQINAMTGAVLNLARATGTDATLASGIMAATIRQFGLAAEDAVRVSDALTVAANKSFNSVESLGEALSYAGPVAADFGMEVEDVLAILGGLGNVGIQGSEAGTAMRRLLTLTAAEAEKMRTIFGVSFLDAAGNARPLIDVLEDVNTVTKDMATGERAQKFNEAFGLLGITGASAIGKSVGSIRELRQALEEASGAAATSAAKMDAGIGGSFRILLSAIEGVAIGIGEALTPAIKWLADQVTLIAGTVLDWIKQNQTLVVALAGVTAGVLAGGVALTGFGMVLGAIGSVATFAATVLGGVATVLGLIVSPIGLLVGGLLAIGAGFTYISGAGSYLTTQLGTLWQALKGITQLLIGGEWGKAWEFAKVSALAMGSTLLDFLGQIPKFTGYALGRTARAVADALKTLALWIAEMQQKIFVAILKSAASFAPKLLKAMFTGDTSGLADVVSGALTQAVAAIGGGFEGLAAGWGKQGAPGFTSSDRTRRLQQQMVQMLRQGQQGTAATVTGEQPAGPAAGYAARAPMLAGPGGPTAPVPFLPPRAIRDQQMQLDQIKLPSVGSAAEGTFSAAAAMASMGARVGRPEEKTAENTAMMRNYLRDLLRETRRKEGLAFG